MRRCCTAPVSDPMGIGILPVYDDVYGQSAKGFALLSPKVAHSTLGLTLKDIPIIKMPQVGKEQMMRRGYYHKH